MRYAYQVVEELPSSLLEEVVDDGLEEELDETQDDVWAQVWEEVCEEVERRARVRQSDVVLRAPDIAAPDVAAPAPRESSASLVVLSFRIYETLADAARQHVASGEGDDALRTLADVVRLLDDVRDRRPFARVLLTIGECYVDLGFPDCAEPRLEEAVTYADELPDVRLGASARRALGRARMMLGDASCIIVLENAWSAFEELRDGRGMLEVEDLLRSTQDIVLERRTR